MRYIDLFAGVGGFRYGIENATIGKRNQQGFSKESKSSSIFNSGAMATQQFTCVYSNEWDKYANSVYKKHYQECDDRDIRTVDAKEIPDFDLLCGGFPCQSFSIAGKRGGFTDTRGTLFFEIARIAKEKRPRLLLLENVKGLLNHDQGRTFGTILNTLDEIGYNVQWQVLNSKDFGVPQNRERVFIIANLRGTPRPEVFPFIGTSQEDFRNVGEDLSYTIDANYHKGTNTLAKGRRQLIEITKAKSQGNRVYNPDGISTTLASNAGGLGAKTGLYAIPVLTPNRINRRQQGRRMKTNGEPSFTLTGQDIHGVYNGVQIRRLTPIECERLQGFPDDWTKYGVDYSKGFHIWRDNIHELIPISDTQRYKMMGNAVTTNVVKTIIERL